MIAAVYRVLYGADFIQESIRSVLPHVDRVFVVVAPRPWGTSHGVEYRGQWIEWPEKFDDIRERVQALQDPRIEIIDDFWPTPFGQWEHVVEEVVVTRCKNLEAVLLMEPDWAFSREEAVLACAEWRALRHGSAQVRQVELWKNAEWRVPEREGRMTPTFCEVVDDKLANMVSPRMLMASVYNLGFCFSESTMKWKHLTGLAFAKEIGDCPPNPNWFEGKWRTWHPEHNNCDLEPALGLEFKILHAVAYDEDVPGEICDAIVRARSVDESR